MSGALSAFKDLRVVELGSWVTAPAASALLADLGADVIKIEPTKGDPSRQVFAAVGATRAEVPTFILDNRSKRSVIVDIDNESDLESLHGLLETTDVFITNVRLDSLERAGLEAETLVARHPKIIYASVTGFGRVGPDRNRPSYDIGAFWARSGLSHQLSSPGNPPINVIGAIGDHVTALSTVAAILAALVERTATGRGGIVETSLLRTGAWVLGWDLALQATGGRVHRADRRDDIRTPLMNSYRTLDDRWLVLMGLEVNRHLGPMLEAIGRADLREDPRFADASSVRANRKDLIEVFDQAIGARTLADWSTDLDAAGIWWSPCASPEEVLADEQLHANGGFAEVPFKDGTAPMLASPFTVFGHRPVVEPAPELGAHTRDVLGRSAFEDPDD